MAIAAAVALSGCVDSARPNLLLITVDTLRADRVGAYGWQSAATSGMDRLAQRGVLFENAFTVSPVTLPAHATLLTGRLPPRHGIRGNSFYTLRDSEVTLAQILKAQGYRTAAFVGAAVLDRRFGLNRGFDVYDDEMPREQAGVLIAERHAGAVVSRALSWLNEDRGRAPFFVWVHLFDPHHPYAPPEPEQSRLRDRPYDGEIAYADREIVRLLSALESRGTLSRTLTVLTSDHGESLGEHGEDTHGVFLYDSTLRVPLIVAGPGVAAGVRVGGDPVSLVDVVPTVLARLKVAVPPGLDGEDLLPRRSPRREYVYSETYLPRDFYNWSELQALRSSVTKFIQAPVPELYDLEEDPLEIRNRAPESPQAVTQLTRSLRLSVHEADEAARVTPDPELARRLQSLGYVAGARPAPSISETSDTRPDPKTRIHLVRRMDQALAFRTARTDRAVELLRIILSEDPTNYLAAHTLGDAFFDLGRDADAIAAYRVAMRDREFAYYHYRLGLLHERQLDYAAAAGHFGRLVKFTAEAANEVIDRADALLERGAVAGALAYLEAIAHASAGDAPYATRLAQARANALNALGVARGEAGELARAAEAFAEAARLAPDDFDSHANLGLTQFRQGDAERALESLGRALAMRPEEIRLINVVAELRFRRHDLEAARDLLARSLAISPKQPRITKALRDVEQRLAAR